MGERTTVAVLAALLVLAGTELDAAADKPRRATTSLERGEREAAAGNCLSARPDLAVAYAKTKDLRALWLLAICDVKLEAWTSAANELAAYVDAKGARADLRARAKATIESIRPKVTELLIALPPGSAFAVDDGPSVLADERPRVFVDPGKRAVHILSGSRDAVIPVDLLPGATTPVTLPATNVNAALATAMEAATSASPEGPPPSLSAANLELEPSAAGAVSVAPVAPAREPRGSAEGSSTRTVVVASLGGVAIGTAALGLYFALGASSSQSEAATLRSDSVAAGRYCSGTNGGGRCAQAFDADRRADGERALAVGFFSGAAAFAASALVARLVWPKATSASASASASPSGAEARVTFAF